MSGRPRFRTLRQSFVALAAAAIGLNGVPFAKSPIDALGQETSAPAVVGRWRQYSYQDKVVWVVGEIQNKNARSIEAPYVVARFENGSGQTVTETVTLADAPILAPGAVSTYRVTLENPPPEARLAGLLAMGQLTDRLPSFGAVMIEQRGQFEEIDQPTLHVDEDGNEITVIDKVRTDNYIVEGVVKNNGAGRIENVRVSAALTDLRGEIVNTGVLTVSSGSLDPGETAGFRLLIYYAPGAVQATVRIFNS